MEHLLTHPQKHPLQQTLVNNFRLQKVRCRSRGSTYVQIRSTCIRSDCYMHGTWVRNILFCEIPYVLNKKHFTKKDLKFSINVNYMQEWPVKSRGTRQGWKHKKITLLWNKWQRRRARKLLYISCITHFHCKNCVCNRCRVVYMYLSFFSATFL